MKTELKKRLENIVKTTSTEKQTDICIEELAELIQAITKVKRYGVTAETKEHLTEELTDVLICIAELRIMYGITEEDINRYFNYKITRTEKRMGIK